MVPPAVQQTPLSLIPISNANFILLPNLTSNLQGLKPWMLWAKQHFQFIRIISTLDDARTSSLGGVNPY